MRNTFLKKVGAVALAAVMAVTFAPLASLTAFANSGVTQGPHTGYIGLDPNATIDSDGNYPARIDTTGTYTVSRTASAVKITIDTDTAEKGTYNFNVTDSTKTIFNLTGVGNTQDITINIKGNPTASQAQVYIPTVDFSGTALANTATGVAIKLSGNLHFASKANVDGSAKLMDALGSEPVATVVKDGNDDDDMYLGNIAISAVQHIEKDPVTVTAYNGAVEVYKLKSGSAAVVNETVYNYGTSIKATANDKTALATVATTLGYKYVVGDNINASVALDGTYVENAYYAGYDRIKSGVVDTKIPCSDGTCETNYVYIGTRTAAAVTLFNINNANKLLNPSTVNYLSTGYSNLTWRYVYLPQYRQFTWVDNNGKTVNDYSWTAVASYDQAISIDQNGEDWTNKYLDAYYFDDNNNYMLNEGKKHNGVLKGQTYYTVDPSSFTKSEDGIAKVDGTKYFVTDHTQYSELEYVAGPAASKSVEILRGTEVKATAGNDFAYDYFENEKDLEVKAPADESLIKATQDNVTGRASWVTNQWRAFGAKRNSERSGYEAIFAYPYKDTKRQNTRTTNNIYVAQVASGSTMSVYVDPRVKVTKDDKLGYFETDVQNADAYNSIVGADWQNVTFGDVANVTKEFVKSVKATKTDAEFYASKEIKTTVAGVDPDVVIKGEINADVVDTAANGTKTWDVNTNAAKAASQVTAHRMYSGREHVYTADPKEIEMLVAAGWKDEGPAFTVNAVASGKGTPIYRLYNKNNGGMHFYTANAAEKDMLLANGWTEGKPVFYGAEKATGIPVYRTYNTGSNNGEHNYTTNMAEVEMNVQKGWRAEGVAFYVFK